jgi:predicted protein tyrosine phosphatase
MNVLFVCTENQARSPMAEGLFYELVGTDARHVARSAGIASHASRRLTTRELAWADVVVVMEERHRELIHRYWLNHVGKVLVLEVPDDYEPGESELRAMLAPKITALIEELDSREEAKAGSR